MTGRVPQGDTNTREAWLHSLGGSKKAVMGSCFQMSASMFAHACV